ncbi:hypothetical protein BG006_009439 [Podila minutissima]|uniref:Ion transport domain-containing protein n=1 Tax=Podila minutissima TaxID=64525 RepID=A0A9P5VPN4_9FUNG|nr:hypothetical protein BG006_009439 [Podila minutissima]
MSTSANRPHELPRRSMHQVDIDLEWPMVEIPQELRELRENQDDDNTRSNSQANAIRNPFKRRLYLLLEDPSSSKAAFVLNAWVSFAIVLSAIITTIETIPSFRSTDTAVWYKLTLSQQLNDMPYCSHTVFFRFTILRLFRLLRVFRTFKYSSTIIMTIEVMIVAIKRSMDALSALFFFLVTGTMLFSTLLYFAERGEWDEARQVFVDANNNPSTFDSIPSAFWFVLVTITTTGYGDMVPTTFIGKLISFPAMMCGVLLITLPSIIIGRNFTLVWEAMQQYRRQAEANAMEQNANDEDEPRPSFDSSHSYEETTRPGYSSLTINNTPNPGQQELLDRLQAMTAVLKQNQQTMDTLQRIMETHELVPKKSPFQNPVEL